MKGTLDDFKKHAGKCQDEGAVDRLCLAWLRLACMDHGTSGEHASALLKVIEDMLGI